MQKDTKSDFSIPTRFHRKYIEQTGKTRSILGPKVYNKKVIKYIFDCISRGIDGIGLKNYFLNKINNLEVTNLSIKDSNLPSSFDGYRILHISDLHLDTNPELYLHIKKKLDGEKFDLAVVTGDIRDKKPYSSFIKELTAIFQGLDVKDGILAILGNHDTLDITPILANLSVVSMINQSVVLNRGSDSVLITGLDDTHSFYSSYSIKTMCHNSDADFKILLCHTPDLYQWAEAAGYRLYLCGHTHGGQVCLPNGSPIVTSTMSGKKFSRGKWKFRGITGYTSRGLGFSRIPVRLFCPAEIGIITLTKG